MVDFGLTIVNCFFPRIVILNAVKDLIGELQKRLL